MIRCRADPGFAKGSRDVDSHVSGTPQARSRDQITPL